MKLAKKASKPAMTKKQMAHEQKEVKMIKEMEKMHKGMKMKAKGKK